MNYLYILFSSNFDKYYVGISASPFERLTYHNNQDKTTFTKKYRPWKIAALFETGENWGTALMIERFIK